MSQHESGESQALGFVWQILLLVLAVMFGLFLISQWLTRLLFEHLVNPWTDGLLERHDGAVVLLSAGLWGGVAAVILFPLAFSQGMFDLLAPAEVMQAWLGTTVAGLVFGVAVGVWVLSYWWAEIENRMPAGYDVIQLLDTPIDIRQPAAPAIPASNGMQPVVMDDLDFEQLILGDEG